MTQCPTMVYQLTTGAIARMMRKEDVKNPTLQAIHVKQVSCIPCKYASKADPASSLNLF